MSEMYGYARVSSKDQCEERRRQGARDRSQHVPEMGRTAGKRLVKSLLALRVDSRNQIW